MRKISEDYNSWDKRYYKWIKLKGNNRVWMNEVKYEDLLDDTDNRKSYEELLKESFKSIDVNRETQFKGLSNKKLTKRIVFLVAKTFIKVLLEDLIINQNIYHFDKKVSIGMNYIRYKKSKFKYHMKTNGYKYKLIVSYWDRIGYYTKLRKEYEDMIVELSNKGYHWDTKIYKNE